MNPFEIWGTYVHGLGKAHEVFEGERRTGNVSGCLGARMVGTFNVEVTRRRFSALLSSLNGKTGFWYRYRNIVPVKYLLCEVTHKSGVSRKAWLANWRPLASVPKHIRKCSMELMSRRLLPEVFKDGSALKVLVFDPWDKATIDAWWPKACRRWFQSFSWGPKRANGQQVWDVLYKYPNWSESTVLDVGCNSGWYSFQAAKYGAAVYGYDPSKKFVDIANTIARHIEYTDVDFGEADPGGAFDVILYLSVHHYVDPDYSNLKKTIEGYKRRCKTLFIELIVPPPGSRMPPEQIHETVGGTELLTYDHIVRCKRTVWKVDGYLK